EPGGAEAGDWADGRIAAYRAPARNGFLSVHAAVEAEVGGPLRSHPADRGVQAGRTPDHACRAGDRQRPVSLRESETAEGRDRLSDGGADPSRDRRRGIPTRLRGGGKEESEAEDRKSSG